jgi:hypothetical protein
MASPILRLGNVVDLTGRRPFSRAPPFFARGQVVTCTMADPLPGSGQFLLSCIRLQTNDLAVG